MTEGIQINGKHIQIFLMSACFELKTAEQEVLRAKQAALRSRPRVRGGGGVLGEEGRKEPGLLPPTCES